MDNQYQEKHNEFMRNIKNFMFIFEVTKCCGYSTFVPIYKNQTLIELYSNIIHHFGNIEVKELYFISKDNERVNIPISNQLVSAFIKDNIICNPVKLTPVYHLPNPIIYKLFLSDCHH